MPAEPTEDLRERLLRVQAERQHEPGYAHPPDTKWMWEFERSFHYTETTDQRRAIDETKLDLEAPRPMDRLICGDVGFGKTEVAIRAAFKTVTGGKEVDLNVKVDPAIIGGLVAFSPASNSVNVIASAGDKSVKLTRVDNGGAVRSYAGGTDFMYGSAITPDGKIVIGGGQDSVLRVWNGDTGTAIRQFDPPASAPATCARGTSFPLCRICWQTSRANTA